MNTRFNLTLEALPHGDDRPAVIRLRAFLKLALRGFKLRCVEAKELTPAPASEPTKPRRRAKAKKVPGGGRSGD